jgi:hypothetical protein
MKNGDMKINNDTTRRNSRSTHTPSKLKILQKELDYRFMFIQMIEIQQSMKQLEHI